MMVRRCWYGLFMGMCLLLWSGSQGCFVSPAVPCNRFDPGFDASQCACTRDADCLAGMRCVASRCVAGGEAGINEPTGETSKPDGSPQPERRLPPETPSNDRVGPEPPADSPDRVAPESTPDQQPVCTEGSTSDCYEGPAGTMGIGPCKAGTKTCTNGQWGPCLGEVKPKPEECNGIDDDCDGQIDKNLTRACYSGPAGTDKNTPCKAGTQTCNAGAWSDCVGQVLPTKETCNKIDDDCNGKLDDTPNGCECSPEGTKETCYTGPAGTVNKGLCKGGMRTCRFNKWGTCQSQVTPTAEVCDGNDNDCDGAIDENLTRACYSGPAGTDKNAPCKAGTQTCKAGAWGACTGEVIPTTESCNGIDDDCNGQIDDGITASADCVVAGARGVCAEGTRQCINGALVCQPSNQASTERCNGVDDDCDGRTDEIANCAPTCLTPSTRAIDFGSLPTSCRTSSQAVTLTNNCTNTAYQISSVRIIPSNADFFFTSAPPSSVSLIPGARATMNVAFRPMASGAHTGAIQIVIDGRDVTEIQLKGQGISSSTTIQETFQVPPASKVDVLFVVDSSASMSRHQTELANAFPSYLTRANQYKADYQIGVITMDTADQGLLEGTTKIITPQTTNASSIFAQNVQVGTSGSGQEQGLATAQMALSPQALGNQNKGFLRTDATLSLVFVSDEEDVSSGTAASYIQFFNSLKTQKNLLRASVLGPYTDSDARCSQPERCRYQDVMKAFGGFALRLDRASPSNIRSFLEQIADTTMGKQAYFTLKQTPNQTSISVKINGTTVNQSSTNGWQYESNGNAVRLTGTAIPSSGSTVEISYRPGCP